MTEAKDKGETVEVDAGQGSTEIMEDVPIAEEAPPTASMGKRDTADDDVENPAASTNEKGIDESETTSKTCGSKYCGWMKFHGVAEAKGYAILGTARGAVVMSNIFLSTSLIYLASGTYTLENTLSMT